MSKHALCPSIALATHFCTEIAKILHEPPFFISQPGDYDFGPENNLLCPLYCQAQPQSQPLLGCAGSIPSFSTLQTGRQAIRNSTFWSVLDFLVKSKVVSLYV